jgi:hypothetical protein
VLQYVLGLDRLGFETVLVEPVATAATADGEAAAEGEAPLSTTPAAAYFDNVVRRFGLHGRACLVRPATGEVHGVDRDELAALEERATVLFNVSGMLPLDGLDRLGVGFGAIPVRVYLDLDPGFNQLWHEACGIDMGFDAHTHHVTVGLSIGRDDCPIPTCGRDWIATLPPVVLDCWPMAGPVTTDALTTVGNWRSYGPIEHDGVHYGQKAHSVRALLALAERSPKSVRAAFDVHPGETADRQALTAHGWSLLDPKAVAGTPDDYHDFVSGSWGEVGIAKSGYVASRSGWFSDRSACYLAAGRPVVAQDTGFSDHLPTGAGLFGFDDVDQAVAAVAAVASDYEHHRHAARRLAEDHFDSDVVLGRVLCEVGAR